MIVEGGRIAAVTAADAADLFSASVVPAGGRFLMSALWDAHAHIFARPATLDLYQANGIGRLQGTAQRKLLSWSGSPSPR